MDNLVVHVLLLRTVRPPGAGTLDVGHAQGELAGQLHVLADELHAIA
ncbi:hypothetical protein ABZY10_34645 [Streptomyces sp. NPDC006539]